MQAAFKVCWWFVRFRLWLYWNSPLVIPHAANGQQLEPSNVLTARAKLRGSEVGLRYLQAISSRICRMVMDCEELVPLGSVGEMAQARG